MISNRFSVACDVAVLDGRNPFREQGYGLIFGVESDERLGIKLRQVDIGLFECKERVQRRWVVCARDRQLVCRAPTVGCAGSTARNEKNERKPKRVVARVASR